MRNHNSQGNSSHPNARFESNRRERERDRDLDYGAGMRRDFDRQHAFIADDDEVDHGWGVPGDRHLQDDPRKYSSARSHEGRLHDREAHRQDHRRYHDRYEHDTSIFEQMGRKVGEKVGEFFGRGPKGYKRSDERIREDVSEKLWAHPRIDASEIEVAVADGVVTLTGTVNNRAMKRMIEDSIDQVSGVRDIINNVRLV